jgi:NTP pyrophosphatase (non-canonical NTP hydrolase)
MENEETQEIIKEINALMKAQSRETAKLILWLVTISSLLGGLAGALVVALLKK